MKFIDYFLIAVGLAFGSYIFEYMEYVSDYHSALRNSFFTTTGVLTTYLMSKIK